MGLVRTNITLPEETLALVDAVAGPRGRSRYIADVVHRQVRRDNARMVFEKYAGAFKDSTTWGRTDAEVHENLRALRDEWDRPWVWEEEDALPAGHDRLDRPQPRKAQRRRAGATAVQRAK
ncbi:MAG: hypothetical protein ACXW4H_02535 [Candidatus Limnocylindrales bacterium]